MPPHIMRLGLAALLLASSQNLLFAQASPEPPAATEQPEAPSAAKQEEPTAAKKVDDEFQRAAEVIHEQTNAFRKQNGLQPVTTNELLTKAAQQFAEYIARTGVFDHYADRRSPAMRASAQGYNYMHISENLAYRFQTGGYDLEALGKIFVEDWKGSPGHRQNMVSDQVDEIGVAVALNPKTGEYYAVQMFGRSTDAEREFRIANRTGVEVSYTMGADSYKLESRYNRVHEHYKENEIVFQPLAAAAASTTEKAPEGQKFAVENGSRFILEKAADGALKVTVEKPDAAAVTQ